MLHIIILLVAVVRGYEDNQKNEKKQTQQCSLRLRILKNQLKIRNLSLKEIVKIIVVN